MADVQYNEGSGGILRYLLGATGAVERTMGDKLADVVSVKDFGAVGDGLADDLAALQAAVDSGAMAIYFPAGTYRVTGSIVKAQAFTAPRFIGENAKVTTIRITGLSTETPIFQIIGGSGQFSYGSIENFTLEADSTAHAVGVQIDGQCGFDIKYCEFKTLQRGVHFYNNLSGNFTENCHVIRCGFASSVIEGVRYSVGSGNASFHGSGLIGCWMNRPANATARAVLIAGAGSPIVYNAPMDCTFFMAGNQTGTINWNSSTGKHQFYGTIRVEGEATTFAGAHELWGGNVLYHAGEAIGLGYFQLGSARLVDTSYRVGAVSPSNGNTMAFHKQERGIKELTTGDNDLSFEGILGQGSLVALHIEAANYEFRALYHCHADGFGGSGTVNAIAENLTVNGAGYGVPTISMPVVGTTKFRITNSNYPASGVTAIATCMEMIGSRGFGDVRANILL